MYFNKYLSLILLCMPLMAQATNAPAMQPYDQQEIEEEVAAEKSTDEILAELKEHLLECGEQEATCPHCLAARALICSPIAESAKDIPHDFSPMTPTVVHEHCFQLADILKRQALFLKGDEKKKARKKALQVIEKVANCAEIDDATKNEAKARILDCYFNGPGISFDPAYCLSIINDLINKNDPAAEHAKMRLGQMLILGQGITDSGYKAGFVLLEQVASQTKNCNARLLACGYLAVCIATNILECQRSSAELALEILHAPNAPLEALTLASYVYELEHIPHCTTFNELQSSTQDIRKMLQGPIPSAVRMFGKTVLYLADAKKVVRQYEIVSQRIDAHSKEIDLLLLADVSAYDASSSSQRRQTLDAEIQDDRSFVQMTVAEKNKIADEFLDQHSLKIFRRLGWKMKRRLQQQAAKLADQE